MDIIFYDLAWISPRSRTGCSDFGSGNIFGNLSQATQDRTRKMSQTNETCIKNQDPAVNSSGQSRGGGWELLQGQMDSDSELTHRKPSSWGTCPLTTKSFERDPTHLMSPFPGLPYLLLSRLLMLRQWPAREERQKMGCG